MVTYNPKDWFKLIFHFHKSDTFRILIPTMLVLGILTAGICAIEKYFLMDRIPSLTIFHQISGFIISLVLVFRINTAYDRWWEGRKLWGSLVNNSRSLAIKLHAMLPCEEVKIREELHLLICNFPFALKEHLRNNSGKEDITFTASFLETDYLRINHKPNYIVNRLASYCLGLTEKNQRSQNDYLILSDILTQFTDICGACERIKNTPIPYSYSIFIKKMIFLYIITMPLAFGITLGYWAVPIVMIIFYAFASLELISEEIEDPFGTDSNDLPTDEIAVRIKANVREIFFTDGN
jgi:putative membrane protein